MDDAILSPDCIILFGSVCAARCFVQYEAFCDPQIVWISLVVHQNFECDLRVLLQFCSVGLLGLILNQVDSGHHFDEF